MYTLTFSTNDVLPFVVIVGSSIFFSLYWFLFISEKIKTWFTQRYAGTQGQVYYFLFTKYSGLVLLGLVPLLLFVAFFPAYTLQRLGLSFSKGTNLLSLYWVVGLGALATTINWFGSRRPKAYAVYPQLRITEWRPRTIALYIVAWAAYLFGYEVLFRAVLFIPLADTLGVWPAIAINMAMYSLAHVPKGVDETVGALVLGLVLCLITLQTGTIWVAFFVHLTLATSNSMTALRFHPEMKIVK
jgi:membrane protease YdiL (CAAX protease family)